MRAEVLRSLRQAFCVEAERSCGWIGQVGEKGVQILGEAICGGLQEILNIGKMAGKICGERALIDAEGAVVVEADAETFEVADAVVAGI